MEQDQAAAVDRASPSDRFGYALAAMGGVFAVGAAVLLWQAQGAAIFLTAAVTSLMNCF
jgi:drug/metabolite transporter superfamily protein YnfA